MTHIRVATNQDGESIRDVHLQAFSEDEGQIVSTLAVSLLGEETSPETVALVAETHSMVAGHIAFSPVTVDSNEKWVGYILAPLGVKPDYQKRGIGTKLIESGIEHLSEKAIDVLFVYGDPKYYGKFGFKADAANKYSPPYELQYPFGWQAIVFNEVDFAISTTKISCVASLCYPELW